MIPEMMALYIPLRMSESGFGQAYYLRFRHLVIAASEVKHIDADGQYFFLTEDVEQISVESNTGVFDLAANHINELQYEHTGKLTITNLSSFPKHVKFIQVIPQQPCYESGT